MRSDYPHWLMAQKYSDNTQTAQIHRVKKVEEAYGSLDDHFAGNTYQSVIDDLQYSTEDERRNRPNPSKIKFDGNIRNNLQSYKNAVVRYRKFLADPEFQARPFSSRPSQAGEDEIITSITATEETLAQRFSLERDMQAALRLNISSLEAGLKIIDDGAERAVNSGLIDITCEDDQSIVIIELKAGKADSRAIGQILGYMGDLQAEEDRPVRGILIAHDFDKRAQAAASIVPSLSLKKYGITFNFTDS